MLNLSISKLARIPAKLTSLLSFTLFLSLSITFIAWTISQDVVNKEHNDRFLQDSNRVQRWIQNRFDLYIIFASGLQGFFEGTDEISQSEWSMYIDRTHIISRYPGIYSINFAEKVTPSSTASSQVSPEFTDTNQEHYLIKLTEPIKGREKLIGFNLLQDKQRSAAIYQARDTGKIISSNKITSLETGKPAFSLVAPIYKKGDYPTTKEERISGIKGVAYISFVEDDVFKSIFGSPDLYSDLDFEIYDNTSKLSTQNLLFDSDPTNTYSEKSHYKHIRISTVKINGDTWGLVVMGKDNYKLKPSQEYLPLVVLSVGIIFSFFSFFFFLHMIIQRTNNSFNKN